MQAWMAGVNWSQARLRLLLTVTIAVALVISFSSIKNLAEYAGFGWRSWLYPLLVDVVAAAGYEVWMTRSQARNWAVSMALFAVSCSMVANIADWWITQGTVLAAVLGALPPFALAWLLLVVHRHRPAVEPGGGAPADEPLVHTRPLPDPVQSDPPVLSPGWVAEQTKPNQALVHQPADGATNHAEPLVRDLGAPSVVAPDRPAPSGDPTVTSSAETATQVKPGEEELVRRLKDAPDLATMTRRSAEKLLSEAAGETVGSTVASRLLKAARNGSAS